MYPRTEYEMSEADLAFILDACKAVPAIMVGGHVSSRQENANRAWAVLGDRMGFDPMSVRPVPGKGNRFFSAVPVETADARDDRIAREKEAARRAEIAQLEQEITERQARLSDLRAGS